MKPGYLILQTGEVFAGDLIGKPDSFVGEVVFHTNMTGHVEVLTDPANAGKIITFCYPLIGNCGFNEARDGQLDKNITGVVMGQLSEEAHADRLPLAKQLEHARIPALVNVDTRTLVKTIRKYHTVQGVITDQLTKYTMEKNWTDTINECLVEKTSTKEVMVYNNDGPHIVVIDYGSKKSIVQSLLKRNCKVTVVPYHYTLEQVNQLQADGVVLSNGPGHPQHVKSIVREIRKIAEAYPTLGISLGHELIALAFGAEVTKLNSGHRGANYPVKELATGKVYMTYQNHGFAVLDESIKKTAFYPTYINVNDKTIEGMKHKFLPIQSVQFLPEAATGPKDTQFIFDNFLHQVMLAGGKTYAKVK